MNLNGDAIIQKETPIEVEFDYIPRDILTRNIFISSYGSITGALDYVVNKIASVPIYAGKTNPVVAYIDNVEIPKYSILWGCDISSCAQPVIPRVLAGPAFYAYSTYKDQGRYCDSRVLIPWAFNIHRSVPEYNIALVTNSDLLDYKEELHIKGIETISSDLVQEQLDLISKSRIVLTDSLSTFIFSEVLGVPVFPFIRDNDIRDLFSNYIAGTNREINSIEFLDFSSRIVIDKLPDKKHARHDTDFLLSNIPFRHEEETVNEIKAYYNEVQKYK